MATLDDMRRWFPDQFGNLSDEEAITKIHAKLGGSRDEIEDKFGYEAPKGTIGGRAKDTAIDLGRGVLGVGKSLVGLGDLATGGAVGRGLEAVGYRPDEADKALSDNYSDARRAAEARVGDASGVLGTAKAYLQNPSTLVGGAVQALPQMVVPEAGAEAVAGRIGARAANAALDLGPQTPKALAAARAAAIAAPAARGAVYGGQAAANASQVAGQTAEDVRAQNPDDEAAMYKSALSAGAAAFAIDRGASMLPGGALASRIATKGAVGSDERGFVARSLLTAGNQAAVGAGFGASQQAAVNAGTGKDLLQGVPEAAAGGAINMGALGLVLGGVHGRSQMADAVDGRTPAPVDTGSAPVAPPPPVEAPPTGVPPVSAPGTAPVAPPEPIKPKTTKAPDRAPSMPEELQEVAARHGPIGERVTPAGTKIPGTSFDGQNYDPGPKGAAKVQAAHDAIVDELRREQTENPLVANIRRDYVAAFKDDAGRLPTSKELHSATDWAYGITDKPALDAFVSEKVRELEEAAAKKAEAAGYSPEIADQYMSPKDAAQYRVLVGLKEKLTGASHAPEDYSALNRNAKKPKADGSAAGKIAEGSKPQDAKPAENVGTEAAGKAQDAGAAQSSEQVRVPAGSDDAGQKERNVTQGERHEGPVQPDVRVEGQGDAGVRGSAERGQPVDKPVDLRGAASDVQGERPGTDGSGTSREGSAGTDARDDAVGAGQADAGAREGESQEITDSKGVMALLKTALPKTADAIIDRHINGMKHTEIAKKYGKSVSWSEKATKLENITPAVVKASAELGIDPKRVFEALSRKRTVAEGDESTLGAKPKGQTESSLNGSIDSTEAAEAGLSATGGKKESAASNETREEHLARKRDEKLEADPKIKAEALELYMKRVAGAFDSRAKRAEKVEARGGPKPPSSARKEASNTKKMARVKNDAVQREALQKLTEARKLELEQQGRAGSAEPETFSQDVQDKAEAVWDQWAKDPDYLGEHDGAFPWEEIPQTRVGAEARRLWMQYIDSEAHDFRRENRASPKFKDEANGDKRERVLSAIMDALAHDETRADEKSKIEAGTMLSKVEFQGGGHDSDLGELTDVSPGSREHDETHKAVGHMLSQGYDLSALDHVVSSDQDDFHGAVKRTTTGRYFMALTKTWAKQVPVRRMWTLLHELHHVMEDASEERIVSADEAWEHHGELHKELEDVAAKNPELAKLFRYPLNDERLKDDPEQFSKELYAQIMAMYDMPEQYGYRQLMEDKLPKAYAKAQEASELIKSYGHTVDADQKPNANAAKSSSATSRDQVRKDQAGNAAASSGQGSGSGQPPGRSEFLRDSPEERRRRIDDTVSRLAPELREGAKDVATNLLYAAKKGVMALSFGHDLAAFAGKAYKMLAPTRIMDKYGVMSAEKHHRDDLIGQDAKDFNALPRPIQDLVQHFLHDSVESGKWGYTPAWKDATTHKVDPSMELRLKAIGQQSPAARELIQRVFKSGHDTYAEKRTVVQEGINSIYRAALAAAKTDEEREAINQERNSELRRLGVEMRERDGPYVPDKRFGDHIVEGKSAAYLAEEENARANDDYSTIRKMRADHAHYFLGFERTEAAAKRARDEVRNKYGWAEHFEKEPFMNKMDGTDFRTFSKLRERAMAAYGDDPKTANAVVNMINELYLHSLGDGHANQNTRKRLGVAGVKWNERMLGYIQQGLADNNLIVQMKHSDDLEREFSAMRQEVRNGEGERDKKQILLNEFQKRRLAAMNAPPAMPWENTAMRFTSAMKLLTSPGYYLQYLSQPLTMAAPLLVARHGAGAYRELSRGIKDAVSMAKRSGKFSDSDWASHNNDAEKRMLDALRDRGVIGIGSEADFGRSVGMSTNMGSKAFNAAVDKLSRISKGLELHNRVGTALAAYRMEMGRNGTTHEQAVERAVNVIRGAYGEYGAYNAPRALMQGGIPALGRLPIGLIGQFKKYSLIHTSLVATLAHNAFKNADANERRIAGKALLFMGGHYGVLAGGLGLPGAALLAGVAHQLAKIWNGNEDDPEDTDLWLERQVGDPDLAKLLLHGVPGAAGIDVTHRVGAGDILSPFPTLDKDPTKKAGFAEDVLAMAGPFVGSMLPDMAHGVGQMMQGDMYGGMLNFMPSGPRDALKAWQMASEGLRDRHGVQLAAPDDLDVRDVLGQALGAHSLKTEQIRRGNTEMQDYVQHYKDRENTLKSDYAKAVEAQDSSEISRVQDEWTEMQQRMRANGMKPPARSVMLRAPQELRRRSRLTDNGIEYRKGNRALAEEIGANVE